jgi:hypothetical protein
VLGHLPKNIVAGAIAFTAGVVLIKRRHRYSAETVRFQNRFFRTSYGSREIRHNVASAIVVGIGFIVLALFFWIAQPF